MVGSNVRRLREASHLSQTELARLAGISRSHLCEIEHDKTSPSLTLLADLARALHTTRGTLLDGAPPACKP